MISKSDTEAGRLKALWHQSGGTLQPDALLQFNQILEADPTSDLVFSSGRILNKTYCFSFFFQHQRMFSIKNASSNSMLPENGQDSLHLWAQQSQQP